MSIAKLRTFLLTKDPVTKKCAYCVSGKFKEVVGSSKCIECKENSYGLKIGATTSSECIECASDRTTASKTGLSNADDCQCRKALYYLGDVDDGDDDSFTHGLTELLSRCRGYSICLEML